MAPRQVIGDSVNLFIVDQRRAAKARQLRKPQGLQGSQNINSGVMEGSLKKAPEAFEQQANQAPREERAVKEEKKPSRAVYSGEDSVLPGHIETTESKSVIESCCTGCITF